MKKLNVIYALIQGTYWCAYCAMNSFAAFFLRSLGYSNTELGVIIAAGSVIAFILPMMISPVIDRSSRLNASVSVVFFQTIAMILALTVFFINRKSLLLSVIYMLCIGMTFVTSPLCTQIALDYGHLGYDIKFGPARAFGSLAFVGASALIGRVTASMSHRILPVISIGMGILLLTMIFLLAVAAKKVTPVVTEGEKSQNGPQKEKSQNVPQEESSSLRCFLAENRNFVLLMSGLALVFCGYQFVCIYMINIVENLGGTSEQMGYVHAVNAAAEIPAMILWGIFGKRKYMKPVLIVAFVSYSLKCIYFGLAGSVSMVYAGAFLQALSLGLYTPAIVDYIIVTIPYKDSVKAQTLTGAMSTFGAIFASTVGGIMNDHFALHTNLMVFSVISACGTALCITAVLRSRKKNR